LFGFMFIASSWPVAAAGTPSPPGPEKRITERVDDSRRIELHGQVHRALRDSIDLGAADPALTIERAIMILRGSNAQEADLEQFLHSVQSRGHADYHRWLTPQAFGQRFGAAMADIAVIRAWLRSEGFRLEEQPLGGRTVLFSGTVALVDAAFSAHMHRYRWHGELHLANATNPSIPAALATVVHGFASLHDFRFQPQFIRSKIPQTNLTNGGHALAPGDFATIYDLTSTYANEITGQGKTVAVIGRSDVQLVDLSTFRSTFGLSSSLPAIILAGSDPGLVSGDQLESDLDLEWAGAVAPSASLKFVTAKSTSTTDGVSLSAQYAVDQNLADVITVSYGACESSDDVSGGTTFFNQLWQQAAAQGISVFVSSGDSGAAGCDVSKSANATHGLGVNLLCSSPYSTCVGGTEFTGDVSNPGAYWSANNSNTLASALGYIGEAVWNQSGSVSGGADLYASGGGASIYYAKPAWQLSPGVPSDGLRDVPDMALNAASNHDPYLIYSSDGNPSSTLEGIGGTSASTPSMAGLAALVAQQQGGRIGSFNPILYGLSSLQAGGGAAVFHTITSGNNSVPSQTGFSASASDPTYNQATGLGSIDGGVLIAHWNDFVSSTAGLTPSTAVVPATVFVGSATLNVPSTTVWSASVSQGAAAWLSVTPASGTGGTPLTVAVAANLASSARTGTITIDGQTLAVTQAAGSGSLAHLNLSASSMAFGTDTVGMTSTGQTLLVSNTGDANLTLSSVSIVGTESTDFADGGSCRAGLVLAPGASCYASISFDPTAAGARTATLQIAISGGGSTGVTLSGSGVASVGSGGDGPLPLWAYVVLAVFLMGIATRPRNFLTSSGQ
jgi:subtilase family serine protease